MSRARNLSLAASVALTGCLDGAAAESPQAPVGTEPTGFPDGSTVEEIMRALYDADPVPNSAWIGGACSADSACAYDGGDCFESTEGFPEGMCSQSCEVLCPDREEPADTTTFCLEGLGVTEGFCVARCDFELLVDGCRRGYRCVPGWRNNNPDTVRSVCLPAGDDHAPPARCYAELLAAGAVTSPWNVQAEQVAGQVCWVEAPVLVHSPVGGVELRSMWDTAPASVAASCELADAVRGMAEMLAERDIVEVLHMGTYNCRVVGGTTTISQHGLGTAIDIAGLVHRDGRTFSVRDHWESGTSTPTTEEGLLLYRFVHDVFDAGLFNVILTPDYNAAHHDHFHMDLTPGSSFLFGRGSGRYIGPNHGH